MSGCLQGVISEGSLPPAAALAATSLPPAPAAAPSEAEPLLPKDETSEAMSDEDGDQAAAAAFDGVLESAISALQNRWNGSVDPKIAAQALSLQHAVPPLLPDNVEAPIISSHLTSFTIGQPVALPPLQPQPLHSQPLQPQQLPSTPALQVPHSALQPHTTAPIQSFQVAQGVVGLQHEAARAAQAAAQAAAGTRPKANTAAAAAAAQAASQLMHAEAEAGTDGRDSSGRPYNPGYQRKTWSAEEDAAIHSLIAQHGTRWRAIAPHLAGRSDDSVRNRCVAAAATPQSGGRLDAHARRPVFGRWKRISEERGLKIPDTAPSPNAGQRAKNAAGRPCHLLARACARA